MMREGSVVSYSGPEGAGGLTWGDQGRLMAYDFETGTCHVLWSTGARRRQSDAIYETCLTAIATPQPPTQAATSLEDSLEVGSLTTLSTRRTYDHGGPAAVVNQMAESGHLASFAGYAEEALQLVAQRIRRDPSFLSVVSGLDEDETEQVFRTASVCLVRDAFTESDLND